jgi:hypothetical protein
MPIGNQSTQPWTPTVNTLMSMSSYKAGLDGNSSVASNTAGALYVYPAVQGLAVVVDTVFNLPQLGQASPIAFSNAASPSVFVVNLTAPLMGSYYGCVY